MIAIKGLHHNAYRCRDSEETRKFYEDFLGLPLAASLELHETMTGRPCKFLHTFFETPDMPHDFPAWHDFDLHIALEVTREHLMEMLDKGKRLGMDPRGVSDHGFIESIYFRDPNNYTIELTAKKSTHDDAVDPAKNRARAILDAWQASKSSSP